MQDYIVAVAGELVVGEAALEMNSTDVIRELCCCNAKKKSGSTMSSFSWATATLISVR